MRQPAHQTQFGRRDLKPDRLAALRAIPLERVLQLCDAEPDAQDPCKWHTAQGALSVQGAKFFHWNCGKGGGGAIDLVIHLQGVDFRHAVQWLQEQFPQSPPASAGPIPSTAVDLQLPPPDPAQLLRVRGYLIQQRALPSALLPPLIQSGDLYADARANAVFLLRGASHEPVGAELRGTTGVCWRGMAPGSRKDLGYFSLPGPLSPCSIILCESAIDALSAATLHPQSRCLSTAGARPDPQWLPGLLRQELPIYCGFDADTTGEIMAQRMIELHPAIQRLRPTLHDWNDVLRAKV
jgi:hypothetical protein